MLHSTGEIVRNAARKAYWTWIRSPPAAVHSSPVLMVASKPSVETGPFDETHLGDMKTTKE
jgi:hypothetical protein